MHEPLNRRSFLAQVATLITASLVPWRGISKEAPRVLIAGGGFAGLYAADLLLRHGYSVRLLEAGDRLGGKALGGQVGGHPYDFGCQAFSNDMPRVKALGKRFGLTVAPRPKQSPLYVQGAKLFSGAALEDLHKDFDVLEDLAKSQYAQLDDASLRPQLAAQSVMDWARPHVRDEVLPYYRSAFCSEWCTPPEEVSLLHYLEYERGYDAETEEMAFRYREGLFSAAEGLAREVAPHAELRCPVESVDVSGTIVRVRAGGRDFEGDYLILALPLLPLRRLPITGVDTSALHGSLVSVENAQVRKILAVYERPFWKNLPREGTFDLPVGMSMMDNSDMAARRYSLAVFLGGPSSAENPGREAVLARVAAALGDEALQPIAYHEQAWLGDDYLCGGYAANRGPTRAPGTSAVIPASLGGRIFIAGSESSRLFPSYVEGALCSAELAAGSIAKAVEAATL